jgi:hypothetical protein
MEGYFLGYNIDFENDSTVTVLDVRRCRKSESRALSTGTVGVALQRATCLRAMIVPQRLGRKILEVMDTMLLVNYIMYTTSRRQHKLSYR